MLRKFVATQFFPFCLKLEANWICNLSILFHFWTKCETFRKSKNLWEITFSYLFSCYIPFVKATKLKNTWTWKYKKYEKKFIESEIFSEMLLAGWYTWVRGWIIISDCVNRIFMRTEKSKKNNKTLFTNVSKFEFALSDAAAVCVDFIAAWNKPKNCEKWFFKPNIRCSVR